MNVDYRSLGERLAFTAAPAVPFVVQTSLSAGVFVSGLYVTQMAGMACRVSCATPIIGSAFGMLGVGLASAAAGQASLQCKQHYRGVPLRHTLRSMRQQDLLLDAVMGIAFWKVMGARFRNVLPSDLFAAGAMAKTSLPAKGPQYATDATKKNLLELFRRDGCHHCGTKKGQVVGDHIPPNRQVWGTSKEIVPPSFKKLAKSFGYIPTPTGRAKPTAASRRASKNPLTRAIRKAKTALAIEPSMPKQRFYPQCQGCSQKQSGAVKNDRRTLLMHHGGLRAAHFAGLVVGLRHHWAETIPPGDWGGSNGGRRRGPTRAYDSFGNALFCIPLALSNQLGDLMVSTGMRLCRPSFEPATAKLHLENPQPKFSIS